MLEKIRVEDLIKLAMEGNLNITIYGNFLTPWIINSERLIPVYHNSSSERTKKIAGFLFVLMDM